MNPYAIAQRISPKNLSPGEYVAFAQVERIARTNGRCASCMFIRNAFVRHLFGFYGIQMRIYYDNLLAGLKKRAKLDRKFEQDCLLEWKCCKALNPLVFGVYKTNAFFFFFFV